MRYLIGVDEVGRGPIAGPLCVGACLMRAGDRRRVFASLRGVRDSKQLSPEERLRWYARIRMTSERGTLTAVTSFVRERVIDRRGISAALTLATRRCLNKFSVSPEHVLILLDGGIRAPARYPFQKTIIDGDETETLIALASIVAKVRRDRWMIRLARRFPEYGFERHKGYGTKKHYEALREFGPCEIHRRSFLKSLIQNP